MTQKNKYGNKLKDGQYPLYFAVAFPRGKSTSKVKRMSGMNLIGRETSSAAKN